MQTSRGELGYQELLWLLGSLCNLYRIPFDPKLIEQEFPPPHSLATFHEAARALGFKTGQGTHPAEWQALPLPAIAFLRAIPETESQTGGKALPVLILKTDGHKLLYFRAGSQTPETITADISDARYNTASCMLYRAAKRASQPPNPRERCMTLRLCTLHVYALRPCSIGCCLGAPFVVSGWGR